LRADSDLNTPQGFRITHAPNPVGYLGYSDAKVANRDGSDFEWEIAHEAVSRRMPIFFYTIVARTHMYTYDASVWDSSLVQGLFSVAPCQTLSVTIRRTPRVGRCLFLYV
jgi:hypothetical protein